MKYEIIGDNQQMVKIDLQPDEGIFAEAGSMVNMSGNMAMESPAQRRDHCRAETGRYR